jgi:hypothetical protein
MIIQFRSKAARKTVTTSRPSVSVTWMQSGLSTAVLSNFLQAIIPDPTELTISSPDLVSARLGAWIYGPRQAAFAYSQC